MSRLAQIEIEGQGWRAFYADERVPRVGEHILWNRNEYLVVKVIWVPHTPTVRLIVTP